ncbi:MAG TPA: S4 domain-containing protein [Pyrinomonadaceae bacterium]|nr:S4 domain-containing protein [Pyrinomonadaceae bacterium]
MRLDLYLKASRLVTRRSIARQLCDSNRVSVNGGAAKASKEIKIGDEIEIVRGSRQTIIKVIDVPGTKQVSKQFAARLFNVLEDKFLTDDEAFY